MNRSPSARKEIYAIYGEWHPPSFGAREIRAAGPSHPWAKQKQRVIQKGTLVITLVCMCLGLALTA